MPDRLPRRVVVDSDGGIDDVAALRYLLGRTDIEVVAVIAVYGNVAVEQATTNLLSVVEVSGRPEIPVAVGAEAATTRPRRPRHDSRHGPDGLGYLTLPAPTTDPVPHSPVELVTSLAARSGPVEVLAIGPLTDVARLVQEAAGALTRVVVMGGRFDDETDPEFNIASDPEAAQVVFGQSGVPVLVVPYDVTVTVTDSLHDAVAAVAMVHPQLMATESGAVEVDVTDRPGLTRLVPADQPGRAGVSVVRRCDRVAVLGELGLG